LGNLEAARCKCPVITTDIPAHRYVMHENAFYFNPYSVAEMVDKIAFVLDNKNVNQVSKVVDSAFSYSERFFSSNVVTTWEEMLFDNIK
jgi:glycosyltransferase involved in cell wall biosynthesis